jgi:hypothetical protein
MLKLLQEVRGFAQFTGRPNEPRTAGSLLLQFWGPLRRKGTAKRKYSIQIAMQEPAEFPQPVPIRHLPQNP